MPRLCVDSSELEAVYHCMSRTVGGLHLFGVEEREMLRQQLWTLAEYCGVQIITYAVLTNHFHVLVRVPKAHEVSDAELIRLYELVHCAEKEAARRHLDHLKGMLRCGGALADAWRRRQQEQMFDLSHFLKLLKMRFSIWYNKKHERKGTLWSERFKSILVETGEAVRTIAAYIDLNPLRAGLCRDPKEYQFCGYAEAVAGKVYAQVGLSAIFGTHWASAFPLYRGYLFGAGSVAKEGARRITHDQLRELEKQDGFLPREQLLLHSVRCFLNGSIIGSMEYIQSVLRRAGRGWSKRCGGGPNPLPSITGLGDFCTLVRMRGPIVC